MLGPIVVNILAFNVFVAGGAVVLQSPVLIASVVATYLLWSGREKSFTLLHS